MSIGATRTVGRKSFPCREQITKSLASSSFPSLMLSDMFLLLDAIALLIVPPFADSATCTSGKPRWLPHSKPVPPSYQSDDDWRPNVSAVLTGDSLHVATFKAASTGLLRCPRSLLEFWWAGLGTGRIWVPVDGSLSLPGCTVPRKACYGWQCCDVVVDAKPERWK